MHYYFVVPGFKLSFPPPGYLPPGYPPQGCSSQGYPSQGYPPQGYPPQAYPPPYSGPDFYPPLVQPPPPQYFQTAASQQVGSKFNSISSPSLCSTNGGFSSNPHPISFSQTSTNVVVVQAPTAVSTTVTRVNVGDYYLTMSIVVTVICFMCFGLPSLLCTIPAIVVAMSVGPGVICVKQLDMLSGIPVFACRIYISWHTKPSKDSKLVTKQIHIIRKRKKL